MTYSTLTTQPSEDQNYKSSNESIVCQNNYYNNNSIRIQNIIENFNFEIKKQNYHDKCEFVELDKDNF